MVSAHRYAAVVAEGLWHTGRCGSQVYARRCRTVDGRRVFVYLHRFIVCPPPDLVVDHANGDGLDCRDENLRVVSPKYNSWNQDGEPGASGYLGVDRRPNGRWRARLTYADGTRRHLGVFDTAYEAAMAYDAAVLRERGPFARVNFATSKPPREPDRDHPIPF